MIIGLVGHSGAGKDTVANILCYCYQFEHLRFADPLKRACMAIFGWDEDAIEGKAKNLVDPRWGISPRQAMQLLGTEFGRELLPEKVMDLRNKIGSDLWVHRCLDGIDARRRIVISDVRFLNEYSAIRNADPNSKIIKITRQGCNGDGHKSETGQEQIPFDVLLENDSSRDALNGKVANILYAWGIK